MRGRAGDCLVGGAATATAAVAVLRGLDMRRAKEVFAGIHFTRADDRFDYVEPRFVTVGMLDSRLVVFVWTPRGSARRIISMRHCHEREAKRLRRYFSRDE